MSNAIVLTKLNIIGKWHGIVRQTSKLTHLDLKPRKESFACICSNISIVKMNTKPIVIHILSKNISSTKKIAFKEISRVA